MASKALKGLTIEIGGDTSELNKELDKVDKRSRNLSSELGQINKLLKLDPKNTELLAQKQKVLAEAISNTEDRLTTLKEAEERAQEQFANGEISEEQYRALQREIIATERKLDGYKKAAKETADAVRDMGKDTDKAGDEIEDTGDEAKKSGKKVDDFADSADKAEESSGGLGETLANVAKAGLAAVGAAVGAAITGLIAAAESTREYRAEMGKLDTAFETAGHSSEAATATYKSLQGVLGETDQAVEAANHLAKLTDNEQDLEKWTDICTGVYGTFGASLPIEGLTEAANETAKTGALTGSLADALNWAGVSEEEFQENLDKCTTEQERQALITETLNGLYSDAAEKYRETNAEIIRANQANEEWQQSLAGVGGAIEPVITDVKLLGASLLSDLVPGVQQVSDAFRGILGGEEGAAADLGAALSDLITQLLDKIAEMAPTLVDVAMSLIGTLVTTLISKIPELVETGIQLILSVIVGIAEALPQVATALAEMIPRLVSVIQESLPQLLDAVILLVESLVAAIDQILPPLIEALPVIIMAVVTAILDALPELLDAIISLVMMLTEYLPDIVSAILPLIPQIISAVCASLAENIPTILTAILDLVILLATEVLPQIVGEIVKMIPIIVKSIVAGLGRILASIGRWFLSLFAKLGEWLGSVISQVGEWAGEMVGKAVELGRNFINSIITFVQQLPSKIWTWLSSAVSKVVQFGSNAVTKAKTAAKNILDAVVNGIKELPAKVLSVGSDLVSGLWNGINDKLQWLKNKIKSFTDSVLSGIKEFFGVNSPSKETAWIGEMLNQGLARGILDNLRTPVNAMRALTAEMLGEAEGLNGMTLERNITHNFAGNAEAMQSQATLLGKLDSILAAIENGQVLLLDGKALVGGTAKQMDSQLGMLRVLSARGAR